MLYSTAAAVGAGEVDSCLSVCERGDPLAFCPELSFLVGPTSQTTYVDQTVLESHSQHQGL